MIIIQIEFRGDIRQAYVGRPECIQCSYILPVGFYAPFNILKRTGINMLVTDDGGNDVLAEIMARQGICGIQLQLLVKEFGIEHIIAH